MLLQQFTLKSADQTAEYHANHSNIKENAKHGSKENINVLCYEDLKTRIFYWYLCSRFHFCFKGMWFTVIVVRRVAAHNNFDARDKRIWGKD